MFVSFIGCVVFVSFGRFLPLSLVGAQNWPACQDSFLGGGNSNILFMSTPNWGNIPRLTTVIFF